MVGPALWKIWRSIGMISNPIYGKIKLMFQTTNQLCYSPKQGVAVWDCQSGVPKVRLQVKPQGKKRWCFGQSAGSKQEIWTNQRKKQARGRAWYNSLLHFVIIQSQVLRLGPRFLMILGFCLMKGKRLLILLEPLTLLQYGVPLLCLLVSRPI